MDIRTKMIFTLVAVALSSMFAFGAVIVPQVEDRLRESTLERLDELAEAKREALSWIIVGWRERVALVASRTQLRTSLDEWTRTGSEAAAGRIKTILADAIGASRSATLLRVHAPDGRIVASATHPGRAPLPARALDPAALPDEPSYLGVELVASGLPQVTFTEPLTLDGRHIGTVVAVFEAYELSELTGHDHGLGETGELMLIVEDWTGAPRTLHPTRNAPESRAGVVLPSGANSLAALALSPTPARVREGVRDYRNEPVWAATRFVPETGWGLVVKVDATEQERPLAAFRAASKRTALILSAFAILAGFVIGLRFALPIHALAAVANRIRDGDLAARAEIRAQDEVGLLSRTFNEMASELEERLTLLHEYRKFFDVSLEMLCMAGTDGYFKRVNPAFERVLGWNARELVERPFYDFVHPDDLEKTGQEVAKLAGGIPTISFVNRYLCKDGSYKLLRWTTYPEPETGLLYAVAHVVEDVAPAGTRGSA